MPSPSHTRFTPTDSQPSGQAPALRVKTHIKAGGYQIGGELQHNETLVQAPRPAAALRVKTCIKAGLLRDEFMVKR